MSKSTFSSFDLMSAYLKKKTIMSFQYIEDKCGKYIANGSLIQVAEFLAGSMAKLLVDSNIQDEDLDEFLNTYKDRVMELYKQHKR